MRDFLIDILNSYKLEGDQMFEICILRNTNYNPWGMIGAYINADEVMEAYDSLATDSTIAGMWIYICGDGGVIDHTVIRWEKRRGNEPLDRIPTTVELPVNYKPGRHEKREDK